MFVQRLYLIRRFALAALFAVAIALIGGAAPTSAQSIDLCRGETDWDNATNQNVQVYILFNGAYVPSTNGVPVSPLPNPYFVLYSGGIWNPNTLNNTNLTYNNFMNEYANYNSFPPMTGQLVLNIVAPYSDNNDSRVFQFTVTDPVYNTNDAFQLKFTQITHDFGTNNCPVIISAASSPPQNNTQTFTLINSNSFSALYQTDRYYLNLINMPQAPTLLTGSAPGVPPNGVVVVVSPISAYTQVNAVNSGDVYRTELVETALKRRGVSPKARIRDHSVVGKRTFFKFEGSEDVLIVDPETRTLTWVAKTADGGRRIVDSAAF